MRIHPSIFTSAKALSLALVFMAVEIPGSGQGIVYVVPPQPYFYSDLPTSQYIDVNGDGTFDFNLLSPNGIEIDLNPLNNNSILSVPEPPPDSGVLVSALIAGTTISSSLSPGMVWYGTNSQFGGSAVVVAAANTGSIGNFQGNTNAYAGFELNIGATNYLGWFYIQNLGANIGQITSWAYENSPNTPIPAGAVPEPSTWALFAAGAIALFVRRSPFRRRNEYFLP